MHATMQTTNALDVLRCFTRLGLTSFGGPVAHIGYFRAEFVTRRGWLDERGFADLVALCQFLPGPASSQLGMAIGLLRAGPIGMVLAWVGFTLPSAIAMAIAGIGVAHLGDLGHAGWLRGLKLVAVAVVAQAVWGMARGLCPDRARATFAVLAAAVVLTAPTMLGQVAAILLGGLAGFAMLPRGTDADGTSLPPVRIARPAAICCLAAFAMLLLGLPLLGATQADPGAGLQVFAAFYRAGSLVFGGGHVVLPLLQEAVVPSGWVSQDGFLAGYGAVQAVPGPLFTFAAFLGGAWGGIGGAALALVAIFLPSFLLVAGAMPFWTVLRHRADVQAALAGVNAAVVGVLLAALYTPVWTGAVATPHDFAIALAAFLLLTAWRAAPWIVVGLGAAAGALT